MTFTLHRLLNIAPGETVTFYRGNIANDVVRSEGKYREILNDVQLAVNDLQQVGKIKVNLRCIERKREATEGTKAQKWAEYVYEAVGL